jgi:integrase
MWPGTALVLKFQLVTARRKGEVISMRWEDISNDMWTIPAEHSKNDFRTEYRYRHLPLNCSAKPNIQATRTGYFLTLSATSILRGDSVSYALYRNR